MWNSKWIGIFRRAIGVGLAIVFPLILTYLTWSNLFDFGSDKGGWVYPRLGDLQLLHFLKIIIAASLIALFARVAAWGYQLHKRITLFAVLTSVTVIQLIAIWWNGVSLGSLVWSDSANGYLSAAANLRPFEILDSYERVRAAQPFHAAGNMPGKILFYRALLLLTESPWLLGAAIILISNCGAYLAYLVVRRLGIQGDAPFYAFLLYLLCPARFFFFPLLNVISPIFILLSLLLLLEAQHLRSKVYGVLTGISIYWMLLFDPLPLTAGILFLGLQLWAIGQVDGNLIDWLVVSSTVAFGVLLGWVSLLSIFNFDTVTAIRLVQIDGAGFNTFAHRQYADWLLPNLKELFAGASASSLALLWGSFWADRGVVRSRKAGKALWSSVGGLPAAQLFSFLLLATILIVDLLGFNRGEVIRLWIYLSVFIQISAAMHYASMKLKLGFYLILGSMVIQTAVTARVITFVLP